MRLERDFQASFVKDLRDIFPDAIIQKNDSGFQGGMPDWVILFDGGGWALLEIKRKKPTKASDFEPNQEWWLEKANNMSFAACVYPENAEDVIYALQQTFRPQRSSRLPKR